MEDVIQTYLLPYDPRYPVVCFDEACKQLFGEVRPAQRPRQGRAARLDYEYERKGVCHQLMMCEPLPGWRHVRVTNGVPGATMPNASGSWWTCITPRRNGFAWCKIT
jgi:hypothetical protein